MRFSKEDTDRRKKAVLGFFKRFPNSSGQDANNVLKDGTLTGKKEPTLNVAAVYDLRKQARKILAEKEAPPQIPGVQKKAVAKVQKKIQKAAKQAPVAAAVNSPEVSGMLKQFIRTLRGEMQRMGNVEEVIVSLRGPARVIRLEKREVVID